MHDPVTPLVIALFASPGVGLRLSTVILAAAAGLAVATSISEHRPLVEALRRRLEALHAARGLAARLVFAERLEAVDHAFSAPDSPPVLLAGWARFRGRLVRAADGLWTRAEAAEEAFPTLDEPARTLEWWAGVVVAVGLCITFLGIVAALSEATASLGAAGLTAAQAQATLIGLLAIASTKFWTSIAGILGSIGLRLVARRRRRQLAELNDDLCAALDVCVEIVTPERLLAEQAAVLGRIAARLEARGFA